MVNPAYTCRNVTVSVHGVTCGVIESLTIELEREGGIESVYGSEQGVHVLGGTKGTYTARRWFLVDTDTDLFFDLFDGKTPFSIIGTVASTTITLSNCIAYRYRPVYGAPADKVGEEISGESTNYASNIA